MNQFKTIFCLCLLLIFPFMGISAAEDEAINVGVFPFEYDKGGEPLAPTVSSLITSNLVNYKFIKLFDRSQMELALKEMKLGMSGVVDETTAAKAGKIRGLKLMIIGSVSNHIIDVRLVDVETLQIISANLGEISDLNQICEHVAASIESQKARESLRTLRNDSPSIEFQLWASKKGTVFPAESALTIGDSIAFHLRSNKDGYVTILDIQPNGDMLILYPNDFTRDNRISGNRAYSIPSEKDEFEITVSEPTGLDTVVGFFSTSKVDWISKKQLEGSGFLNIKKNEKLGLARGLKITSSRLKTNDWETTTLQLNVSK